MEGANATGNSEQLRRIYPPVKDPRKVGTYNPRCKSGGGTMYKDVLEYYGCIAGQGTTFAIPSTATCLPRRFPTARRVRRNRWFWCCRILGSAGTTSSMISGWFTRTASPNGALNGCLRMWQRPLPKRFLPNCGVNIQTRNRDAG